MVKASAVLGLAACATMAGTVLVAAPAQAHTGPSSAGGSVRLPAAPAASAAAGVAKASAPGISPATRTSHVASGGSFVCADGNLCTAVWDATTGSWKIFFLYTCRTYSLSNWTGGGRYYDSQTGGVISTFYGKSGNVLTSFRAAHQTVDYNWSPVWSIKNC